MRRAVSIVAALAAALLVAPPARAQAPAGGDLDERIRSLEREVEALKQEQEAVQAVKPGLADFLISGYATAQFRDVEGEPSTFGASLNPVLLWRYSDRLVFEAEIELELEDDETGVNLEYAQLAYFLNDFVAVGAGKFLVPFGIFGERLHPTWINKLPTAPLGFQHHGGIAPMTEVGAQVRGGLPLFGSARASYAAYVTNGPVLLTSGHHAGELRFGNADDNNNNKAVGGRIGLLVIPGLELGVSAITGRVSPDGFAQNDVDALLLGADLSYVREADVFAGRIDLRAEYVKQDIDRATYVVGPNTFDFDNEKWTAYGQIAYRPTRVGVSFIRDLEFVYRYSTLDWAEGTPWPGGVDRTQHAAGLNYWLAPSAVLKLSYERTDVDGADDVKALTAQVAWGF